MPERHADPLFSLAYDDELDPAARRRFSTHLEECDRCAEAWDEYRTALDAVRALPLMTMPATVRLPHTPPAVARIPFWVRLREGVLHPAPLVAAGGLAAVAIAFVAVAAHHGGGTPANSSVASNEALAGGIAAQAPAALGQVTPCPVAPVAASVQPASFSHSASSDAGSGRELVLATPQESYSPGASVPIYARLTTSGATAGASDVVPCVTLETSPSTSGSLAAPAPGAAPQAPGAAAAPVHGAPPQAGARSAGSGADSQPEPSSTPIAVATAEPQSFSVPGKSASGGSGAAGGPLLSVVIPKNIAPGTILRLVAVIPPHYPGNPTNAPIEVDLLITVR